MEFFFYVDIFFPKKNIIRDFSESPEIEYGNNKNRTR